VFRFFGFRLFFPRGIDISLGGMNIFMYGECFAHSFFVRERRVEILVMYWDSPVQRRSGYSVEVWKPMRGGKVGLTNPLGELSFTIPPLSRRRTAMSLVVLYVCYERIVLNFLVFSDLLDTILKIVSKFLCV